MRGKPVLCNETGKVYPTISAAEKDLNIKSGSISSAIKNDTSVDGYTFSYYTEDEPQILESDEAEVDQVDVDIVEVDEVKEINNNQESSEYEEEQPIEIEPEVSKVYYSSGENNSLEYRQDLSQRLRFRGYDCQVFKDKLLFFSIQDIAEAQNLHDLLLKEGYGGPYQIFPYNSDRYIDIIKD